MIKFHWIYQATVYIQFPWFLRTKVSDMFLNFSFTIQERRNFCSKVHLKRAIPYLTCGYKDEDLIHFTLRKGRESRRRERLLSLKSVHHNQQNQSQVSYVSAQKYTTEDLILRGRRNFKNYTSTRRKNKTFLYQVRKCLHCTSKYVPLSSQKESYCISTKSPIFGILEIKRNSYSGHQSREKPSPC